MNICVIGAGYVGLVASACFSEIGHRVVCIDTNIDKINRLSQGDVPIYEPGLSELLKKNILAGRLKFSTDLTSGLSESLIIFIAVGTPPLQDGSADMNHVLSVAKQIGQIINKYSVIVTKSTVPIGSTNIIQKTIKEEIDKRGINIEFDVVSNPEFLREGVAVTDFMQPDRIIIASTSSKAIDHMKTLYAPISVNGIKTLIMDIASSEITKYASNAMLATRISFMNEIAEICAAAGGDIENVKKGLGLDHRIGKEFLSAGIGYGGSCFPKDIKALINSARSLQIETPILNAVENVNRSQRVKFIRMIQAEMGNDLNGRKLAVWGLAFKPDTDDVRESPAIDCIAILRNMGAELYLHDPQAIKSAQLILGDKNIMYMQDCYEKLNECDALIIFTDWGIYIEADLNVLKHSLKQPIIFDGRNIFDPILMKQHGFKYKCIGRNA